MVDMSAIVATANQQETALQQLDSAIDAKINAIKDAEWDKPLSAAEQATINDLRSQQAAILAAIEELAYVTEGALDTSDELTRMANALTGVVNDLNSRKAAITAIGTAADNFSATLDALNGLVTQIKALASGK